MKYNIPFKFAKDPIDSFMSEYHNRKCTSNIFV